MGRTYLRTLGDCEKHGVVLSITCRACQRVAYVAPGFLIGLRSATAGGAREMRLDRFEHRMLCRGSNGEVGCGHRGARMKPLWPHEIPGVPKGVPVLPWLHADDRERQRMIRHARG